MLEPVRIEEIDQLLNELEELAQSEQSRQRFLQLLLDRLRVLLQAAGTAFALPNVDGQWLWVASSGSFTADTAKMLPACNELPTSGFHSTDHRLLAVPIRSDSGLGNDPLATSAWRRGALAVVFASQPTQADAAEIGRLLSAFAEVLALRQSAEAEQFLSTKWSSLQASLVSFSASNSIDEYASRLTNDFAALINADRVSLVGARGRSQHVLAVSGVVEPQSKSDTVRAIGRVGATVLRDGQPLCWREIDNNPADKLADATPHISTADRAFLATNVLGLAIATPKVAKREKSGSSAASRTAGATTMLLLEWQDYDAFVSGCFTLQHVFPSVVTNWQQQTRWLALPRFVRSAQAGWSKAVAPKRITGRFVKLALLLAVVASVLWCLTIPTPLRIETQGTLQPVNQRFVFAALDGIVHSVLVDDGETVDAGALLAELRSPALEIQMQETLGEMKANVEKRDGLNVAINQLASDDPQAFSRQSRLSSEIRELETQMATLQEKRDALEEQRASLQIYAPISGSVVARDINEKLLQRPVRRGDALLRIVQLDGPWRLELLVADQDSGYVRKQLFEPDSRMAGQVTGDDGRTQLEYVIAAEPNKRRLAHAAWLAEAARNPNGDGVYVDLFANTEYLAGTKSHMGATVHAYLRCGSKPFWFVWTRPLVESIQRNLWF